MRWTKTLVLALAAGLAVVPHGVSAQGVPGPGGPVPGRRIRLSGEPRSPIDPDPDVCRFYGRCPEGIERCAQEMPSLRPVRREHLAACHLA